jgi:hypothetical protein
LAIISESDRLDKRRYGNTQLRYSMLYVCITFVVLLFLNFYCSKITQQMIRQGKESIMMEKALFTASEIAGNDVVNTTTVRTTITGMDSLLVTRLTVTDHAGKILYDTTDPRHTGNFALFPEIVDALGCNKVFSWYYRSGTVESRVAVPIMSYGKLIGCVYMMESDGTQGALIASLEKNILAITLVLEIFVIVFSIAFASNIHNQHTTILVSCMITSRHKIARSRNIFMKETPFCTIGNTITTVTHQHIVCNFMSRHTHVRISKISAHRILHHTKIFLPHHIPTTAKCFS